MEDNALKLLLDITPFPLSADRPERGQVAAGAVYTKELEDNLFQPMLPDGMKSFTDGDGSELESSRSPGKMQALHSSSALGGNIFQYWKSINAVPVIAAHYG